METITSDCVEQLKKHLRADNLEMFCYDYEKTFILIPQFKIINYNNNDLAENFSV